MNLFYLVPRFIRHFLPERITRFLLLRNWVIQASFETNDSQFAIKRYVDALEANNKTIKGKRVMVFGYGGRFDIGVGLVEAGAGHVILCDKYARPDEIHNRALLEKYSSYLRLERSEAQSKDIVRPAPEYLTLLEADIRTVTPEQCAPVDIVISNSVYEHLDDVDGITKSLATLTKPDGIHVHFIDLRDHYFKYPFEMLKFSERTWYGWLNPTSNHNRYRLWDYREVFEKYFGKVDILVLERDESNFERARPEILPEFISGKLEDDCATLIRVVVKK
jgi:SAM-dependent methyltransferase